MVFFIVFLLFKNNKSNKQKKKLRATENELNLKHNVVIFYTIKRESE